ncbi:MAG: flippase [Flavobacteriales bacterium]|nr:flippase [Flavobacteriales bacterium]
MELSFGNIIKKGTNAILLQGLSIVITLVLNWYLAKKLGAEDYGIFTYAFSWVYLFGLLSMLGMESVIQREVVRLSPPRIKTLISYARKNAFYVSLAITILFSAVVYALSPQFEDGLLRPMLVAIIVLPVFTQMLVNKHVSIAFKKTEASIIPESIIRPLVTLLLLFVAWNYYATPDLETAILSVIIALAVAYFSSVVMVRKDLTSAPKDTAEGTRHWFKLGLTFFVIVATSTINSYADILMLGFFGQTDQAGIYNIAVKFSSFIALPLFMLNKVIAPYISEFFESRKEDLALIIKKSIRIIFSLGAAGMLIFIFAGKPLLGYFGEEFKSGYFALLLIGGGQMINLFVGPVGNILRMSAFEKEALISMVLSTLINIILNLVLIPLYGMNGAAIATFTSLVFWNVYQFILVKRKLNMNLSVI